MLHWSGRLLIVASVVLSAAGVFFFPEGFSGSEPLQAVLVEQPIQDVGNVPIGQDVEVVYRLINSSGSPRPFVGAKGL